MTTTSFLRTSLFLLALAMPAGAQTAEPSPAAAAAPASAVADQAREFLAMYSSLMQQLSTASAEASWASSTDVNDINTGQRIGADKVYSAFSGSPYIINTARKLLEQKALLDEPTVRQLSKVLYNGAHAPGTIPEVIRQRAEAEAKAAATQDSFEFCYEKKADGTCAKTMTPNQMDKILAESKDLAERQKVWETSKQSGPVLEPVLAELVELRNKIGKETGFSSYFHLMVSDYDMTVDEMMALNARFVDELKPLYDQLHAWGRHKLAERYGQPVPKTMPAHWLENRWSQRWGGIVPGINLDDLVKAREPEWFVKQAEAFYVSMGMPDLPEAFWKRSDLYELPEDSKRKKNTHASAWHMDYEQDVRSLMSIEPTFKWFSTTHHELGHIYYYLAYARPEVPLVLREGANRAFHEAIGELIAGATRQEQYLRQVGVLPATEKVDRMAWLLDEAFSEVTFIPWSAGVMAHFEHDLYEKPMNVDDYNKAWWGYVLRFQGIEPPTPRGEEFCDGATKTHIIDDPAAYYDYALSKVIQYQLHDHIARKILKADPRDCNYYGNKEVGAFLTGLLKLGATRNWRDVIKEQTGEDLSTRAMVDYFAPVMDFLKKENEGRTIGW